MIGKMARDMALDSSLVISLSCILRASYSGGTRIPKTYLENFISRCLLLRIRW